MKEQQQQQQRQTQQQRAGKADIKQVLAPAPEPYQPQQHLQTHAQPPLSGTSAIPTSPREPDARGSGAGASADNDTNLVNAFPQLLPPQSKPWQQLPAGPVQSLLLHGNPLCRSVYSKPRPDQTKEQDANAQQQQQQAVLLHMGSAPVAPSTTTLATSSARPFGPSPLRRPQHMDARSVHQQTVLSPALQAQLNQQQMFQQMQQQQLRIQQQQQQQHPQVQLQLQLQMQQQNKAGQQLYYTPQPQTGLPPQGYVPQYLSVKKCLQQSQANLAALPKQLLQQPQAQSPLLYTQHAKPSNPALHAKQHPVDQQDTRQRQVSISNLVDQSSGGVRMCSVQNDFVSANVSTNSFTKDAGLKMEYNLDPCWSSSPSLNLSSGFSPVHVPLQRIRSKSQLSEDQSLVSSAPELHASIDSDVNTDPNNSQGCLDLAQGACADESSLPKERDRSSRGSRGSRGRGRGQGRGRGGGRGSGRGASVSMNVSAKSESVANQDDIKKAASGVKRPRKAKKQVTAEPTRDIANKSGNSGTGTNDSDASTTAGAPDLREYSNDGEEDKAEVDVAPRVKRKYKFCQVKVFPRDQIPQDAKTSGMSEEQAALHNQMRRVRLYRQFNVLRAQFREARAKRIAKVAELHEAFKIYTDLETDVNAMLSLIVEFTPPTEHGPHGRQALFKAWIHALGERQRAAKKAADVTAATAAVAPKPDDQTRRRPRQ